MRLLFVIGVSHCGRHACTWENRNTQGWTCYVAEGLEVLLVLACYVSSLFLRRPLSILPPLSTARKRKAPSGERKKKLRNALTPRLWYHTFCEGNERGKRKNVSCHCAHGNNGLVFFL